MKCPKCGYESIWGIETISRENPCPSCGFDMEGVEFYGEASASYVDYKEAL